MEGVEISYYKKLFQTVENIMQLIEKDDIPQYLLFLENIFPYMEKYHYQKGMTEIIQELKRLVKTDNHGTASDRALLLDYQATIEAKPPKAIQLEKEALSQIKRSVRVQAFSTLFVPIIRLNTSRIMGPYIIAHGQGTHFETIYMWIKF